MITSARPWFRGTSVEMKGGVVPIVGLVLLVFAGFLADRDCNYNGMIASAKPWLRGTSVEIKGGVVPIVGLVVLAIADCVSPLFRSSEFWS